AVRPGVVKTAEASGAAAAISPTPLVVGGGIALDAADFGALRRAEAPTLPRAPLATLRLTGLLPVLRRTLGVLDLLSSLRLRSGISSALVFFLALARLAARFSASFFALRSAFFSSLAFSRSRSARASARFF